MTVNVQDFAVHVHTLNLATHLIDSAFFLVLQWTTWQVYGWNPEHRGTGVTRSNIEEPESVLSHLEPFHGKRLDHTVCGHLIQCCIGDSMFGGNTI